MSGPVIDLFAGPGGWDVAAEALGITPLGVEWDDAACKTRAAAGLRTLQGDVGALDPLDVMGDHFPYASNEGCHPLWGLIASPPCQAFSMAGKGAGRGAMDAYAAAIRLMAAGKPYDVAALDEASGDERGHLVLEPLRWALALRPRWVACEQVEPVLPLWEATATALREHGYSVWVGVLSAEQYGVPQTRKRAILLASLDGAVDRPAPTHQRYIPPRRKDVQEHSLFAAPEPERIVHAEDHALLPWVSMAEALGWTDGEVGFPRRADTESNKAAGVVAIDGVDYRERDLRAVTQPSFVLTEKARSWIRFRSNAQPNATVRSLDEPAPMTAAGLAAGRDVWTDSDQPLSAGWASARPATTVACDPRVHPPGHKVNAEDLAAGREDYEGRAGANAVRVSIAEASVLQSFPADYPWQGTKSKAFQQIGNAIPPLLALAVLTVVVPAEARVAA